MAIRKTLSLIPADSYVMKSNSKNARDFRVIAEKLLYPYHHVNTDEAYAHVQREYKVGKVAADILALMLARPVGCIPNDNFISVGTIEDELRRNWTVLEAQNLVVCDIDWANIEPAHSLDKAFVLSVQKDLPLDEAQEKVVRRLFDRALDQTALMCSRPRPESSGSTKTLDLAWKSSRPQEESEEEEGECETVLALSGEVDEDGEEIMVEAPKPKEEKTGGEFAPVTELDEALSRYGATPFGALLRRLTDGLTHEQKALFYYMCGQFKEHFIAPLHPSYVDGVASALLGKHCGALMEKGLLVSCYVWDREKNITDTDYYRISPEAAFLFHGKESVINKRVVSSVGRFTSPESIAKKALFFNQEDRKNVERLRLAAGTEEYERIVSELKARNLRPCLSVLMYGPAGTGKTELAMQVARETGRALLNADISKLHGLYIGEGEMNLRNLFQTYRYICAVSKTLPILFLDEGDGLMGKRLTDVQRAADRDANSMQNVILEELNTLPGIVIVTTNLINNFDEAMYRRFMIKAMFHMPDEETRAAIWRSKLPSLSREDAAGLASQFSLTGGNIDNVVSVAVTDEILYRKPVTLDDLASYCRAQTIGTDLGHNRIGF